MTLLLWQGMQGRLSTHKQNLLQAPSGLQGPSCRLHPASSLAGHQNGYSFGPGVPAGAQLSPEAW